MAMLVHKYLSDDFTACKGFESWNAADFVLFCQFAEVIDINFHKINFVKFMTELFKNRSDFLARWTP